MIIYYSKQICLAQPISFDCFNCSYRNPFIYFNWLVLSLTSYDSFISLKISRYRQCLGYLLKYSWKIDTVNLFIRERNFKEPSMVREHFDHNVLSERQCRAFNDF